MGESKYVTKGRRMTRRIARPPFCFNKTAPPMFAKILVRVCVLLVVISGLAYSESLSADAICRKVTETYRNLRMYQFAAQLNIDYNVRGSAAGGETHYALAMVKPDKVRLTKKEQDRELIIVSDAETTWKYLPRTKQYTRESVATLED